MFTDWRALANSQPLLTSGLFILVDGHVSKLGCRSGGPLGAVVRHSSRTTVSPAPRMMQTTSRPAPNSKPSTLNIGLSPHYGPLVDSSQANIGKKATRAPEHWMLLTMAVAVAIGFVVLGVFIAPDERGYGTHEKLGLPSCVMMDVTGIPCPGCGVTTSVALAANGRFAESFINQPFGLFCALAGALFVLWAFWTHFRGRDIYSGVRKIRLGRWGIRLGIAMAVAWVYKIVQLY